MCRSRAIFNNPSLEDLGTFSCVATNTDGMSSSYTLTEEGESNLSLVHSGNLKLVLEDSGGPRGRMFTFASVVIGLNRLLDISHDKKFPSQYSTAELS